MMNIKLNLKLEPSSVNGVEIFINIFEKKKPMGFYGLDFKEL